MTKQEWKYLYSAARLLKSAKYPADDTRIVGQWNTPASSIVWDITYRYIHDNMPKCVAEAVFNYNSTFYNIKENPIMIKHNSKTFNRKMVIRESKMKWRAK